MGWFIIDNGKAVPLDMLGNNNEYGGSKMEMIKEEHKGKNQILTMTIGTEKENSFDWLESTIMELFEVFLRDTKEEIKYVEDIKEVKIKMTLIRDEVK